MLVNLRIFGCVIGNVEGITVMPKLAKQREQHAVPSAHIEDFFRHAQAVGDIREPVYAALEYVVECGIISVIEFSAAAQRQCQLVDLLFREIVNWLQDFGLVRAHGLLRHHSGR